MVTQGYVENLAQILQSKILGLGNNTERTISVS